MEKKDVKEILNKVINGTANHDEEQIAKYWLHYFSRNDINELSTDELTEETEAIYNSLISEHPNLIIENPKLIIENLNGEQTPKTIKLKSVWYRQLTVAASLMLVAGAGLFYYYSHHQKQPENITALRAKAVNDIAPGQTTATLTLSGGKTIILSEQAAGKIAEQSDVTISKTADGKLVYKINNQTSDKGHISPLATQLNILTTARGQQYQVVLPDGSRIWLNADSKLTFPATFTAHSRREVELTGEAYFEIAKDKAHPFIVKTNKQKVEVLGTHFNINSYGDEHAVKTTLLEGSVKVSDDKEHRILKPGQQSLLVKNTLNVRKADTEEAVAWKNGDFVFNNEEFGSILRQVARWYNVEIINNSRHKNLFLSGTMSRSNHISKVLRALEVTGKVKFEVKGNRVIVTD